MGRNKLKLNYFFIFRPFPFRVENQNTGEALSLWHLTSSAPSLPFHVEKTETGPEVKASYHSYPPKTGNYQRSFVLRRHAHTGPLCPLDFVPAAIASAVCLLMHFYKFRTLLTDSINKFLFNSNIKTKENELNLNNFIR